MLASRRRLSFADTGRTTHAVAPSGAAQARRPHKQNSLNQKSIYHYLAAPHRQAARATQADAQSPSAAVNASVKEVTRLVFPRNPSICPPAVALLERTPKPYPHLCRHRHEAPSYIHTPGLTEDSDLLSLHTASNDIINETVRSVKGLLGYFFDFFARRCPMRRRRRLGAGTAKPTLTHGSAGGYCNGIHT